MAPAPAKFIYDHAYNLGPSLLPFQRLAERGFTLDDQMVEHPGRLECHFILFTGRQVEGEGQQRRQYMEFALVADKAAYEEFLRKEEDFSKTHPNGIEEEDFFGSGLSFRCLTPLEEHFEAKNALAQKAGLTFTHKNYEWKSDSVSRLPGWNFVSRARGRCPGARVLDYGI